VLGNSSTRVPAHTPAVLVSSNDLIGLGNRLPAVVTGYVLALFTQRLFLLQSTSLEYVQLPFPVDWKQHSDRFSNHTQCNVPWKKLPDGSTGFCEDSYVNRTGNSTADIYFFSSFDYDLPLLQINPAFRKYFRKFFPDGQVSHAILQYLLRPAPVLQEAMQPYLADAQHCAVGMHIRTRKYSGVRVKQFISIARMLIQGQAGSVFVASDASLFQYVQRALPGRKVWWSQHTSTALEAAQRTQGNNPGSELSALVDILLLAHCRQLILTPASSMGAMAAALAGVSPVYVNFGQHLDPFLNPWFWQSPTSEPCFTKASSMHLSTEPLARHFRDRHPLYLFHNQCHYQNHLRAAPPFLKLLTNDTSYLTTLLN
jgi:xyloglucan fucosyltransferase